MAMDDDTLGILGGGEPGDGEESLADDETPDEEPGADTTIYLKYMFEGAADLPSLTARLRALADELDAKQAAGWRMAGPVDGGWAHLEPPDVDGH